MQRPCAKLQLMETCAQLLVPGLTVDKVVVLCILVNAYTTYPCLVLVIQARAPASLKPLTWTMHFLQHCCSMPLKQRMRWQHPLFTSHISFRVTMKQYSNASNATKSVHPTELPSSIEICRTA